MGTGASDFTALLAGASSTGGKARDHPRPGGGSRAVRAACGTWVGQVW